MDWTIITGHLAALGLLGFAVAFTLVIYFKSREDVRKITEANERMRDEMHSDMEKMTESLLYVIDGLTKLRNESNDLLEEHDEHERRITEMLGHLNRILEKTKNGNGTHH